MTILALLKATGPAGVALLALLLKVKELSPDVLGPKIDEILASESTALALENLVNLATILPGELADIGQGKIDPRKHPSDLA